MPHVDGLRARWPPREGDVAQLGEYLNGIQGVTGSNPVVSTRSKRKRPPSLLGGLLSF